jgi:hypothetical protein
MKKIALVMILLIPLILKGQDKKWLIYPSLGIDMGGALPFPFSDIPEGSKGTPKLNPSLGFGFKYEMIEKWCISTELSYHVLAFSAKATVRSQSFYSDNHQDILYFTGYSKTDVELRFLQIPLIVSYDLNPNWSILLGPYYSKILDGSFSTEGTEGYLSDNKAITDSASLPGTANVPYNFNNFIDTWDAGILLGFRYKLNHRVDFWGNFNVGFKSIFVANFDNIEYEMYQFRVNFGVSIILFNKNP